MPMACQEHLENNKNRINLSFSVVETGVPREKPLQAKLTSDLFILSLFLYLQCLEKKIKKNKELPRFYVHKLHIVNLYFNVRTVSSEGKN
jgi:hypothetical protein